MKYISYLEGSISYFFLSVSQPHACLLSARNRLSKKVKK